MKLSKSKLALAKVINENGGWPKDCKWSVQNGRGLIGFSINKPVRNGSKSWVADGGFNFKIEVCKPLKNWHQCVLNREEYYQAYPMTDDDGWVEWKGGECHVDNDSLVDVKFPDGSEYFNTDAYGDWSSESDTPISHYRQSKKVVKPELCESVMRSIPEPEFDDAGARLAKALELVKSAAPHMLRDKYKFDGNEVMGERKPTIEQLAQDYRNAKDYAERSQKEADEAKAAADAALGELERAGEALELLIGIAKPDREQELVITDWRDLQVNDVIFVGEHDWYESGEYVVVWLEDSDYDGDYAVMAVGIDGIERCMDTAMEWRFISRP